MERKRWGRERTKEGEKETRTGEVWIGIGEGKEKGGIEEGDEG